MESTSRRRARKIADYHLAGGDPLGWFDEVYATAGEDMAAIPWADAQPNPKLLQWLDGGGEAGEGRRALVVGCGLGDDAEELSRHGFDVTAFDISPISIAWCRKRFPDSTVEYHAADLFQAPAQWANRFDFVFEAYTLQSLPGDLRPLAMGDIAQFLAPGGTVLVVARGRDPHEPDTGPPWPLTRSELATFNAHGLVELSFVDDMDGDDPSTRRFMGLYRKSDKAF